MFRIRNFFLTLSAVALLLTSCDSIDDNIKNRIGESSENRIGDKSGILLVTFGSSYEAPHLTFEGIYQRAKSKFVDEEIRWAYTSDFIIKKLHEGNGEGALSGQIIDIDTPEEAMKRMIEEGYDKISVQSLHVIPGEEFDELVETVEETQLQNESVEIVVGKPLLNSKEDLAKVARVLAVKFAAQIRAKELIIFMGHGTPHENDRKYAELEMELKKIYSNFFIGTVEGTGFDNGTTSIGGILTKLEALNLNNKNVTISPLMSIAGDHANNDMNGVTGESDPAEQSWRERLNAAGYNVTDIMKGLGDYNEIVDIWLSHLEEVIE